MKSTIDYSNSVLGPQVFKDSQSQLYECREDFVYKTSNPYKKKLEIFDDIAIQDKDAENLKGQWLSKTFKNDLPIHLEIGTGYGHFMHDFCLKNEDKNFIGIDHRFKRSFQLAKRLAKLEHRNFKLLRAKGERIDFMFNDSEVDQIYFFFPDPWPKTRHLKKRLFQLPFLTKLHKVLKANGRVIIKTDHEDYAYWMEKVLQDNPYFKVLLSSHDIHNNLEKNILNEFQTKFEKIFISQEKKIHGFILENIKSLEI